MSTVTDAPTFYGVAAKIGGSETEVKSLKKTSDSDAAQEAHLRGNTHAGSAKLIIDTIVKTAELYKATYEQTGAKMPAFVSWAGQETKEGFLHPNFAIDGVDEKEAFDFKGALNTALTEAGLDPKEVDLKVDNDGNWTVQGNAAKYGSQVREGENVGNGIFGTGYNYNYAENKKADGSFASIVNTEDGHEIMGDLDKYAVLEGSHRQEMTSPVTSKKAPSELYVAGGNKEDIYVGPKAIAARLLVLREEHTKAHINKPRTAPKLPESDFQKALKLLGATEEEFGASPLFHDQVASTLRAAYKAGAYIPSGDIMPTKLDDLNKIIGHYAKQGDKLALKIMEFTAMRAASRLASNVKKHHGNASLVTASGGLAKAWHKLDSVWAAFESTIKEALGKDVLVRFNQPELDGTLDVVKAKLDYLYRTHNQAA